MAKFTIKVVESREFLVTYEFEAENLEEALSEPLAYVAEEISCSQLDDSEGQLFVDHIARNGEVVEVPEEFRLSTRAGRIALEVKNKEQLEAAIDKIPAETLKEAMFDIATRLSFDSEGNYNPEESVAADSGADFVDSVTQTFHWMGINL